MVLDCLCYVRNHDHNKTVYLFHYVIETNFVFWKEAQKRTVELKGMIRLVWLHSNFDHIFVKFLWCDTNARMFLVNQ